MLKEIKYETRDINNVVLDLAEEIKFGWKLHSFSWPYTEASIGCNSNITIEVTLSKRFEHG